MTDRRGFIGSVAGGLLALPGRAPAQPANGARIGVLASSHGPLWEEFRRGMNELGYVEGRNLAIEWRWAEGRADRFPDLANELVRSKVDMIVTVSTQAALAARQATRSLPIVMAISAYPERLGLADSLARPGGNVTGLTNIAPELAGKRVQLLRESMPKVSRVAMVWNHASRIEQYGFDEALATGTTIGVEFHSIDVRTPEDYPAAFAAVMAGRADALGVVGNPVNFKSAQLIADFALKNRLPSFYDERTFVGVGGLLSYGPSFLEMYRRAATYVDKILKGAKPADLPIQQPTTFEFVINAKTAKALGLTIPQAVLSRADEVIR